jgi:hypothetical protein
MACVLPWKLSETALTTSTYGVVRCPTLWVRRTREASGQDSARTVQICTTDDEVTVARHLDAIATNRGQWSV